MRIVGGTARGVPLVAPQGRDVRPTSDRVREALFNILGDRVPGSRFLDLYAGTGAVGLEAASRGAGGVVLVERARPAVDCICRNIAKTRLEERVGVVVATLPGALDRVAARHGVFDLVFADPPYQALEAGLLLEALEAQALVAPGGLVVVEHLARQDLPEAAGGLQRQRTAVYGDTAISLFS